MPPMRAPDGFTVRDPVPVDNGHSFIIENRTRGIAPDELPEGSVHGVNPVQKWQVDTLRDRKHVSDAELGSAVQLHSSAVIETHEAMHRMIDDWEYQAAQADLLRTSVQNASVEFRSAQEFSNIHKQHIEDLRAESRELALKEAELDLATSALPWVKHLPPDFPSCKLCAPFRVPVALCRVVRGHCKDLPKGDTLDAVSFLHANFTENAPRRGRFSLSSLSDGFC